MPFFSKPKYSTVIAPRKKDIPKDLYVRCPKSGELIYNKELEKNLMVVPKSGYHFPMTAAQRVEMFADPGSWQEWDAEMEAVDSLQFKDTKAYADRLQEYKAKTGLKDALVSGMCTMEQLPVALAIMDFRFGGASMGAVVGEKIARAVERALEARAAVIVVSASGGARMQEGVISLMQMAKTSAALARLAKAGLPYISVLTHPTTGGVTASYATLGDVILAEPEALICFAGPRVIKEGTNQELPEGFQKSEFLLQHGLIDQIVPRTQLRERIVHFLRVMHPAARGLAV